MHSHDHTPIVAAENPPIYYEVIETAVRELLIEKQLIRAAEIRRQIEVLDSRTPALGAKVVAKAWLDPEFRARLLNNGRKACEELGITFYDDTELIVLENTDRIHNPIVWFFFGAFRLYPGGQLKSIEWLQKHRKKLPQSLWGAERVTPIKIEFRHIETSNEYALRTPDEIEFLDNLKAVRRRSESTMAATQYD